MVRSFETNEFCLPLEPVRSVVIIALHRGGPSPVVPHVKVFRVTYMLCVCRLQMFVLAPGEKRLHTLETSILLNMRALLGAFGSVLETTSKHGIPERADKR